MSDPFFRKARPFTKRKREEKEGRQGVGKKRVAGSAAGAKRGGKGGGRGSGERAQRVADEEEEDEDLRAINAQDSDDDAVESDLGGESSDDQRETAAQKRLRLSQMYLDSLKTEQDG